MHIRLIDANSLGYAQHHGQPERLDEFGRPVQAVAGVLSHVRSFLTSKPDVFNVFLWDEKAVWRYAVLPGYKSGRHRTPEQQASRRDYVAQQPLIRQALSGLPVAQISAKGAEADDLGWGLSKTLARQGHLVTLYSTDVDWLQGVSARVSWQDARSPHKLIDLDTFSKMTGGFAGPHLIAPVKALAGDSSDDIPGVDQIGDKRALSLLGKYSNLETLLKATENFMEFSAEPSYAHALMQPDVVERVRRNLKLVDLSLAPPIKSENTSLGFATGNELDLYEVFQDANLINFVNQFKDWRILSERTIPKAVQLTLERSVLELERAWD